MRVSLGCYKADLLQVVNGCPRPLHPLGRGFLLRGAEASVPISQAEAGGAHPEIEFV
jgi:hypothetical protein